jgi:hypothetical protein
MSPRPVLGLAALALVAAAVPSHAAGPAVLDGKKVRKITRTASGGLQDNDTDNASIDPPSALVDCAMPRCYRLDFVYRPAKGVKGNLALRIAWANPVSDLDLYLVNDKNGDMADCGSVGGTSETVVIPGTKLRPGKRYTLVADFYRSVNDTVTATVEFPTSRTLPTTVPADVDDFFPTNCVLAD